MSFNGSETCYLAAGCFWGVQEAFRKTSGVQESAVGYAGGHLQNPTYNDVCYSDSGHAEAVEVVFVPSLISYKQILEIFWTIHNPTTLNRQGPDIGSQYRSAIFYTNLEQKEISETSLQSLVDGNTYSNPVVTEITSLNIFWRAEEYHQKYIMKKHFNIEK